MFCKKCGKLKANINISCTIGPIERHTKNINIGNKNTLFPYIGVDGRRFNNIIEKWTDFLGSKCKEGYCIRYANKYDAFWVRGVTMTVKQFDFTNVKELSILK